MNSAADTTIFVWDQHSDRLDKSIEISPNECNNNTNYSSNSEFPRLHQPSTTIFFHDESALEIVNLTRFPKEKVKTLFSLAWLALNFFLAAVSLVLTHEKLPDPKTTNPLPDVVLDNISPYEWALTASEIILSLATFLAVGIIFIHEHKWIIGRRVAFILGTLYLVRSVTMYITVLPVASRHYGHFVCAPKANTTSPFIIIQRALHILSGFGLEMNGQHIYCGDYIFSGHTVALMISYNIINEYSPKRWICLHWISWLMTMVAIILIPISQWHYTIDVLIAYYMATRMWWIYHTMANNPALKKSSSTNYIGKVWWFPVFQYLEENVGGIVPHQFICPLSWLKELHSKL